MQYQVQLLKMPPQTNRNGTTKKDAFGQALTTYYIKGKQKTQVREHIVNFLIKWKKIRGKLTAKEFCELNNLTWHFPAIGNDPFEYTWNQIIDQLESQTQELQSNGNYKDLTLSLINRYNRLIKELVIGNKTNNEISNDDLDLLEQNLIDLTYEQV